MTRWFWEPANRHRFATPYVAILAKVFVDLTATKSAELHDGENYELRIMNYEGEIGRNSSFVILNSS